MTFRQNIARFVTGAIGLRSMPAIALLAMEQGLDSPSLHILAGLSVTENEFVIDKYFKDTLSELSIGLPDKRKAAIEVGLAIADEIFENKRSIFQGVKDIKEEAIDAYPFYEETKHYCYDSIGFEKVYGLFDTIDDLRNAGSTQWQTDKTNQELEQELTKNLVTELKQWSVLMKNGGYHLYVKIAAEAIDTSFTITPANC
ncbi:MAG TPA: hypothetical protein VNS58_29705 [Puia sp.]|nr:hypothetical protein [Puia sp.]